MANYKLVLDDDLKMEFSLVAIHCSAEAYRMAYLINKHIGLELKRCARDLDYSKEGVEITFPWFDFEDANYYTQYDLLANKCKTSVTHVTAEGDLFGGETSEEIVSSYILPELKTVDFLMKISSEFQQVPIRKFLLTINEIDEVISAYQVEVEDLKSKNNLIFD